MSFSVGRRPGGAISSSAAASWNGLTNGKASGIGLDGACGGGEPAPKSWPQSEPPAWVTASGFEAAVAGLSSLLDCSQAASHLDRAPTAKIAMISPVMRAPLSPLPVRIFELRWLAAPLPWAESWEVNWRAVASSFLAAVAAPRTGSHFGVKYSGWMIAAPVVG